MTTAHYSDESVRLYHGDCIEVMRQLPDASVDAVVTDPPYGLEFMGKEWDAFRTPRDPRTAGRSGKGGVVGGAAIKEGGLSRVSYGGKRPTTWRCDGCGKRDQFRVHSTRVPDCQGTWELEVIDPDAPSPLLGFQLWCTEWATEALRVLKPGGHLLAFGGTRTWHRLACAIEDAGFEVRDSIAWMYGSGFPKSLDVSKAMDKAAGAEREVVGRNEATAARNPNGKTGTMRLDGFTTVAELEAAAERGDKCPNGRDAATTLARLLDRDVAAITAPATDLARKWQGWGTALKPAFEPVVVARKPLIGTVAANVERYGTGALNIDGGRIGTDGGTRRDGKADQPNDAGWENMRGHGIAELNAGRWPANVILDESQAEALDRQSGVSSSGQPTDDRGKGGIWSPSTGKPAGPQHGDTGGASRFFYTAKADSSERPRVDGVAHPTVKPLDLMRYLVRLVTPPGGVVLEPFAGSGTTLEACIVEGFRCIGIEREADYIPLIMARITKPIEVTLL